MPLRRFWLRQYDDNCKGKNKGNGNSKGNSNSKGKGNDKGKGKGNSNGNGNYGDSGFARMTIGATPTAGADSLSA